MYDTNNNYLPSYYGNQRTNQNYNYSIRVACRSGEHLRVEEGSISGITIEGKFPEDAGYTNLEGTGLLMTPYAGFTHQVDLRIKIASGQEYVPFDFTFITD